MLPSVWTKNYQEVCELKLSENLLQNIYTKLNSTMLTMILIWVLNISLLKTKEGGGKVYWSSSNVTKASRLPGLLLVSLVQ